MSVLSLTAARAAGVGAELSDDALQDAIDEEEAWLARRIGQLAGERTQRFPLSALRPRSSELHLQRPTDAVAITSDGVLLDADTLELRPGGWVVAQLPEATRYSGVLEATYEPNDLDEVVRALKQLLGTQLAQVSSSGVSMEQIGTYMYQRAPGAAGARTRAGIVRGLREPSEATSMRLRSSVRYGLAGSLGR